MVRISRTSISFERVPHANRLLPIPRGVVQSWCYRARYVQGCFRIVLHDVATRQITVTSYSLVAGKKRKLFHVIVICKYTF